MLLAVPDDSRLGNVDQVHAWPGRVGGDRLVTQVETDAPGRGRLTTRVKRIAAGVKARSGKRVA
jgi:hypothetical protein